MILSNVGSWIVILLTNLLILWATNKNVKNWYQQWPILGRQLKENEDSWKVSTPNCQVFQQYIEKIDNLSFMFSIRIRSTNRSSCSVSVIISSGPCASLPNRAYDFLYKRRLSLQRKRKPCTCELILKLAFCQSTFRKDKILYQYM